MDLKLSHDKQILWGMLYGELSKSYEVMEFAWKDAMVVLFLSIIYTSILSCYSLPQHYTAELLILYITRSELYCKALKVTLYNLYRL